MMFNDLHNLRPHYNLKFKTYCLQISHFYKAFNQNTSVLTTLRRKITEELRSKKLCQKSFSRRCMSENNKTFSTLYRLNIVDKTHEMGIRFVWGHWVCEPAGKRGSVGTMDGGRHDADNLGSLTFLPMSTITQVLPRSQYKREPM